MRDTLLSFRTWLSCILIMEAVCSFETLESNTNTYVSVWSLKKDKPPWTYDPNFTFRINLYLCMHL